jgi:hypothetical protein
MTGFARLVADSLKEEKFTLVDIGCSGGIDAQWRLFGDRLAAVGFDASASECRRLSAQETNPSVRYVAGFVDIPPDHPFVKLDGVKWPGHYGSFYDETSSKWTMELRAARLKEAANDEKLLHNMWGATELADPDKPVYATHVLNEMGVSNVDVLKIDVDGPDFRILNSFDGLFAKLGIVAARMEVNMYGGFNPTAHIFCNTDRFMRQQGYRLVRLDCYEYSKRALPARYRYVTPSNTLSGRAFQAEAHYALVPTGADGKELATPLTPEKLLKLAAVFSLWNQPDGAAEILLEFRERLEPLLDVDAALDLLAAQTQASMGVQQPLSYRDYMALFATDSPDFFPPPDSSPGPRSFLNETLDATRGDWLPDTFLVMPRLQDGASVRRAADDTSDTTTARSVSSLLRKLALPRSQDGASAGGRAGTPRRPIRFLDETIDTTTAPYVYSMLWQFDTTILQHQTRGGTITVEVSVDVGAGRLGILWVDEAFQPIAESERTVSVHPHRQHVLVSAPVTRARHLVFRNQAQEGLATSFVVRNLRAKVTTHTVSEPSTAGFSA